MKDSLTKSNMAMTVRFMAGLTKFQTSSENIDDLADIVISLETTDRQKLIENLHWIFETQNPTFIQRLMGNKDFIQRLMGNKEQTLKWSCSRANFNPFDLYALWYCIANSSTLWSVDIIDCNLTDECTRMLLIVENGNAFYHITSLNLRGSSIKNSMASILGKCCYSLLACSVFTERRNLNFLYLAESLLKHWSNSFLVIDVSPKYLKNPIGLPVHF